MLSQDDPLAVVVEPAVIVARNGIRTPACAVFIFEEIGLFFWRMISLVILIDATLSIRIAAAGRQRSVDLIICDEGTNIVYGSDLRMILLPGKMKVSQPAKKLMRLVKAEPQETVILFPCRYECAEL